VFVTALCACSGVVSTRKLADAFNGGALDGTPDPFYDRSQRAVDTVAWRMREELGGAYFEQGRADSPVVRWLHYLEEHAPDFMREMVANELAQGAMGSESDAGTEDHGGTATKAVPASQRRLRAALKTIQADKASAPLSPGDEPLCGAAGGGQAMARFVDSVRFHVAIAAAVKNAADLVGERFATMDEAIAASRRAFTDSATYLANRKWQRDLHHRVTGLVVKGGAATGVFSAGVVYVALNLIDECLKAGVCDAAQAGFVMASGTSTGATVVTAADVFHSDLANQDSRTKALNDYRDWYMCSSTNDLYCVRNHVAFDLARSHPGDSLLVEDSFLDFNGLAGKAESAYHCKEMNNRMELILNTVDFRTGRLYALTDQDPATLRTPWDVAKAVVSSAALPFIVRPTYTLPIDPVHAGNFSYLDGGIRSELPLLALVRRGVERLLVVSSGASVTDDHAPIANALDMAIRYIDISTGGVTEAEIDHARWRAEASRLSEYDACLAALDDVKTRTGRSVCEGNCNADALCAGDFAHACGGPRKPPSNEEIVEASFQTTSVWRNEDRVPSLPGYAFNPDAQRRLMLAGAEAARDQCRQIALALDIDLSHVTPTQLYDWCTPHLPTSVDQCGAEKLAQLKKTPDAPDCADDRGPTPSPDAGSTVACSTGAP
jgi:predicted acylesterase/phospholipase RssA